MLLNEREYCVAIVFKMTKRAQQQLCIRFCIKFEHSSTETTLMIQKATAMCNLVIGSFITTTCSLMYQVSFRVFCKKHQITQVTRTPYSPGLACCDLWLSLKLKSPLKGKKFQTVDEIQENMTRQLMAIGRTV